MSRLTDRSLDDDPQQPAIGRRAYPAGAVSGEGEGAGSPGATEPGDQGQPAHSAYEDADRTASRTMSNESNYRGG
jgi:hypothetical protein